MTYQAGKGWVPSSEDPNWEVVPTAPGKCLFRFAGKAQFALDTTGGFYATTFYKDGRPEGEPQLGRIIHADLVDQRAWNVVVQAPTKKGVYRMQLTMAGDVFMIYLTEPGTDPTRLRPHGITIHQRRTSP